MKDNIYNDYSLLYYNDGLEEQEFLDTLETLILEKENFSLDTQELLK